MVRRLIARRRATGDPRRRLACALVLVGLASIDVRAGDDLELSGGYTVVGQTVDDGSVESEATASGDLFLTWARGSGRLQVYVEASSSPRDGGVSSLLPEANADAGTALDGDGNGRLQLSELKYAFQFDGGHMLTAGLVDLTAHFDSTRIDNDENLQFVGAPFVNNPAIEFPDYTLGAIYELPEAGKRPGLGLAVTGSEGLADNPSATYGDLVDLGARGKGLFLAAEARWATPGFLHRCGVWANTADHTALDGSAAARSNFGLYGVSGRHLGPFALSLRLGLADPDVSRTAAFAALSAQYERSRLVLGIAAGHAWHSDRIPAGGVDDTDQLEIYLSLAATPSLFVTPSVQYLSNSGFDASGSVTDDQVLVFGLRLHQKF